jgi:hypothetical protein
MVAASIGLAVLAIAVVVAGEILHGKDVGRRGFGGWPFSLRDHLLVLAVILLTIAVVLLCVDRSRRSAPRQTSSVVASRPRFTTH